MCWARFYTGRLTRDRMVSMMEILLHNLPLRSVRVAMLVGVWFWSRIGRGSIYVLAEDTRLT